MPTVNAHQTNMLRVATLDELRQRTCIVVRGSDRPIAVFHEDGRVYAVDNRCPHMGFPLHKGTIKDGMITCHWHHARFDACSGCTFDLFADDVPGYDVEVRGDEVFVADRPRAQDVVEHAKRRLREGMEQNLGLISAKAILTLRGAGVSDTEIIRQIALFGLRNRDGIGPGMVVLAAIANLLPHLSERTAFIGLFQAARRVASDCAGQPPRRDRHALETDAIDYATLDRWLRYWTTVRHRDGAERTLLTAIDDPQTSDDKLVRMLALAATERFYADTGHVLDFLNKSFELLDVVGREHAATVLPPLMGQMVRARGGEELNSWRHPVDLAPLVRELGEQLPQRFTAAPAADWQGEAALAEAMLGDDPQSVLTAIGEAIDAGAKPAQLGRALALAAAMRVARFGTANEIGDWISALHSFSYCNAADQLLSRCDDPLLVRSVLHGAISVYLNRFLNVPPAKLPHERGKLDDLPTHGPALLEQFLSALDSQHQVEQAARVVARYLSLGHDAQPLLDTLALAVLREDFDFHSLQMVEAGVRQYTRWGNTQEGHAILIAVARYLAAHSPTQRGQLQTANIAMRLHRKEDVYEE